MYNTDMYNIKSKNMLLKIKSIQIYSFPEKSQLSAFPFSSGTKKILSHSIFLCWESIIQKYKHADTWIIYSKFSVYKPNFPNSKKLQKAVCIIQV